MKTHVSSRVLIILSIVLSLGFSVACSKGSAVPGRPKVEVLKDATAVLPDENDRLTLQATLNDFYASNALKPFFDEAYGFALFPTIGKGGIGVGGAFGKGYVFKGNDISGTSTMTQVTIGWQLGGQAYSQVIFFADEAAYHNFTGGNFEFGAQASAVAITVEANAQVNTAGGATGGASANTSTTQAKTSYTNGMAIFTIGKGGLMYEASIGGQKFSFRPLKAAE